MRDRRSLSGRRAGPSVGLARRRVPCIVRRTQRGDGSMMDRGIRSLAYVAIAAQAAFVASWIVAGAVTPGYSHAHSGVSALAAHGMPRPWIVMAGLTLLGLSAVALAPGIRRVLPSRPAG